MPVRICHFTLIILLLFAHRTKGQNDKYVIRTIGFYNVENLFDTIDDPEKIDEAYTPSGKNHYSHHDYVQKIKNTAKVISEIGSDRNRGPVLLGLAEIENFNVLHDLIQTDALRSKQYQIIHHDSPDRRGIDVALLYQIKFFSPIETKVIELRLWNEKGERIYTRDILYIKGILDDEKIHVLVNHWPSRRGGKSRSDPKRMKAAYLIKQQTDQIFMEDPHAKIFILGDFNDDPMDKSILSGLLLQSDIEKQSDAGFVNPMKRMHKKGMNTLAYRDGLNLFDQIIFSNSLSRMAYETTGYTFYRAGIYNPSYLITKHGKYKGYPLRSFVNNNYSGGYSDHFPVYVELIKPYFE